MRMQSSPSPKCKSEDKQVWSNRGHRVRGQVGARSLSADDAIRWHKTPVSCSSSATGARGQRKHPASPAGFTQLFPSFHPQFFPVPTGCWVPRQRAATEMMGEISRRASLPAGMGRVRPALPAGALFGSRSQRGSARSYGRRFGNEGRAPGWSSRANTSCNKELAQQT